MSALMPTRTAEPQPETTITMPAVVTPMAMIDRALSSGATPETLEKLLALQERWDRNEARKAYNAAIAAAKAEIRPIIKNQSASFGAGKTAYDYEDLMAIASMVDPILNRNGLSYRYTSKVEAGQVTVGCVVFHTLGHSEETPLSAPADTSGSKNAVQAIGSSVTYLQRYTLKLALGLVATKDDDAHKASQTDLAIGLTAEQAQELQQLIDDSGSDEPKMLAYVGAQSLHEMTIAQYAKAKHAMQVKLQKKAGK